MYPNIVSTKKITLEGLETLINKGTLLWSSSFYDIRHIYNEGLIRWSKNKVAIYFIRENEEKLFKLIILTEDLNVINLLLSGLNKFFTID